MNPGFYRYIEHTKLEELWGIVPTAAGFRDIPPDYPFYVYPPETGRYAWLNGRTLNEYHVVYVSAGCGVFHSHDAGVVEVKAGDMIVVFPDVWHLYYPQKRIGWSEQWAGFLGEFPDRLLAQGLISPKCPILRIGTGVVDHLFGEITDAIQHPVTLRASVVGAKLATIVTLALEASGRLTAVSPEQTEQERMIVNAASLIENAAYGPLSLDKLAQETAMSTRNFRRLFTQAHGMSPQSYHLKSRVSKAKHLLLRSDAKIEQIASALGYAEVNQFYRMFKKVTGTTPCAWRDSAQAKDTENNIDV